MPRSASSSISAQPRCSERWCSPRWCGWPPSLCASASYDERPRVMPGERASPGRPGWSRGRQDWLVAVRILAILVFVGATNYGFAQRVLLVIDQGRLTTLVGFIGVWALCLVCLLVAVLQPNVWIRVGWALVFAAATAAGVAFRLASGGELGILDVLSLWMARHEIGRAA